MTYVALLRGINVGGKAKVPMSELRTLFANAGCGDVETYINSGNVIFNDVRGPKELSKTLELRIKKHFGFHVPVIVKHSKDISKLCDHIPTDWTNDLQQKTDVVFLWESVDSPDVLDVLPTRQDIDHVKYIAGTVVWNIDRTNATRSGLHKIIGTEFYSQVTVRNINTVKKLDALMKARKPL